MNKPTQAQRRKKVVKEFFVLVAQGRQAEALGFFSSDCRQHNPYVKGGMRALFDSMAAVQREAPSYPDPSFAVKRVVVEGDVVAAHTERLASRSDPGKGDSGRSTSSASGGTRSWSTGTSHR